MSTAAQDRTLLSRDIHLLGDLLGQVIREHAGIEMFGRIELIRALSKARRSDPDPETDPDPDRLAMASTRRFARAG